MSHVYVFNLASAALLTFQRYLILARSPLIVRVNSAIEKKKKKNSGYRDLYNLLVSQRRCVKPRGALDVRFARDDIITYDV